MSITFQKSGLSDLTIERGRLFPAKSKIRINQDRYLTESMNAKVVSRGASAQFITLKISGLSADNYDGTVNGLKTWFESATINWSAASFTMVDEDGTSHTVRYWRDDFDMPEVSPNRYEITIELKKEA